jgi:hypothetical protein
MRVIYGFLTDWRACVPSMLQRPADEFNVQSSIDREFDALRKSKLPVIVGLVYTPFSLFVFYVGGIFQGIPFSFILPGVFILMASSFLAGLGLCSLLFLSKLVWMLGQYPIRVTTHKFGILSVGRLLLKCNIAAGVIWFVYTGASTWSLPPEQRMIPLLFLSIPAVTYIIAIFVICQLRLRDRMKDYKRAHLIELDKALRDLSDAASPAQLPKEKLDRYNFLQSELDRVTHWPEWPFTGRVFVGVCSVAIGAIAPSLISVVLSVIHDLRLT